MTPRKDRQQDCTGLSRRMENAQAHTSLGQDILMGLGHAACPRAEPKAAPSLSKVLVGFQSTKNSSPC